MTTDLRVQPALFLSPDRGHSAADCPAPPRPEGTSAMTASPPATRTNTTLPDTPTVMLITPEIAADWIKHFNLPTNRTPSEATALRHAQTMKSGRWLLTHQGIAFNKNGFMIDGQTRMRALVLAGVAVKFWVFPNCEDETFAVLDSGRKRQAAQMLRIPHATIIASAARSVGAITREVPVSSNTQGGVYDSLMPTDLILQVVENWPELATLAKDVTLANRNASINSPVHLAVLAQAARTRHQHQIDGWLEGVTYGASLPKDDPRLHLRNRFTRDHRTLAHNRRLAYNLIVKAWNYHVTGRSIELLKVLDAEGLLAVTR